MQFTKSTFALLLQFSLSLIVLIYSPSVKANHLYGGDISWQVTPNGEYIFTLKIYTDCGGVNLTTASKSIFGSSGISILCPFAGRNYLNDACDAQPCDSITSAFSGATEEFVFRSAPITLLGSPPIYGWCFSWVGCCRAATTNLASLGSGDDLTIQAYMYPYIPPGAGAPLPASAGYNNSPTFMPLPDLTFCAGIPEVFSNYAFDVDGDSLHFELAQALIGPCYSGPPVSYAAGYSYSVPLGPSATSNLNSHTGDFSFNSAIQGAFTVCIKVEEWRCGQKIGQVFRELPVITKACMPAPGLCGSQTNNAPDIQFEWISGYDTLTPVFGSATIPDYYEMTVAPNTPVKFRVVASDAGLLPNCLPQTIKLKAHSPFLASAPLYNATSQCLAGQNCATLTSLNNNGLFDAPLTNSVEFNWTPACQPAGLMPFACQNSQEPFWFWFEFVDNACAMPKSRRILIRIVVDRLITKPTITSQYSNVCPGDSTQLTASGNFANYTWSTGATGNTIWAKPGTYWVLTTDTAACLSADTITIFTNTPYTTVPKLCWVTYNDTTGFTDIFWEKPSSKGTTAYRIYKAALQSYALLTQLNQNEPSHFIDSVSTPSSRYYLTLVDSCGFEYGSQSDNHRTIRLAGNPTFSGVQLSWNAYEGAVPGNYIIYRRDNASAAFVKYDTVNAQTLNYLDQQLPNSAFAGYMVSAWFDSICSPSAVFIPVESYSNQLIFYDLGLNQFSMSSISLNPNPSAGIFKLSEPIEGFYQVVLPNGNTVKTGILDSQQIDVSELPNGFYIVVLTQSSSGFSAQFKIVKMD